MPTLEWIGKDKVVNHHQEVPFRILDKKYTFNAESSENNLIHSYRSRKDEYVIYNLAGMRKSIIRRVKLFEMIIVLTFAAFISIFSSALLTFILDQGLRQSSFMLIRGLLS